MTFHENLLQRVGMLYIDMLVDQDKTERGTFLRAEPVPMFCYKEIVG